MDAPVQSPSRFGRSHRLVWAAMASAIGLCLIVMFHPSPEAAQVATVTIPSLLALVAGWTGITNWAEVRRP